MRLDSIRDSSPRAGTAHASRTLRNEHHSRTISKPALTQRHRTRNKRPDALTGIDSYKGAMDSIICRDDQGACRPNAQR